MRRQRQTEFIWAARTSAVASFGSDKKAMYLKKGDKVITSQYSGTKIKFEGEELIIVKQNDILAIVE